MVAGSYSNECALAVSADRLWKVICAGQDTTILPKVCAGFIDAHEIDGDIVTLKLNPAVEDAVVKNRVLVRDAAARVVKTEVLEGGKVGKQFKSKVMELKLEPTGDAACVAKHKVDYETLDGELSPEDQAELSQGYIGMLKMVEAYLVAHPAEYA